MSIVPYANVVGSIMYTMVCTRPNIAHAVSVTSRYMGSWEISLECSEMDS